MSDIKPTNPEVLNEDGDWIPFDMFEQKQVHQFREKFGLPVRYAPMGIAHNARLLHIELITEELSELKTAARDGDLEGVADGITDLIYVAIGMACEYGINLGPIFDEVHTANMRKVGGPTREDGKILKPRGWIGPDVAARLAEQGWKP